MTKLEFLKELFSFFKGGLNEKVVRIYDCALDTPYLVDWDRLFMYIVKTAETRTLPTPKYLLELLPQFRVNTNESVDEYLIRVTYFDGFVYDFVMSWLGTDKKQLRFDRIKRIEKYPSGTVFVNGKMFAEKDNVKPVVLYDYEREKNIWNMSL